jgi:DNA-binding NtrC family response regulator
MIVDDDVVVLHALEQLVSSWGYQPVPFSTFEDARAFLEASAPDALIVDVRLGRFNGLHLLHLARQAHSAMVMLVVSGYDDPVLREETDRLHAQFLLKPLDLGELRRLLTIDGRRSA